LWLAGHWRGTHKKQTPAIQINFRSIQSCRDKEQKP